MKVCKGATRIVFVFKRFVVKIPNIIRYEFFLHGLLANLQERCWSRHHKDLAPVKYCNRLGFILIMAYAEPCPYDTELLQIVLDIKYKQDDLKDFLLSDCKPENWGLINSQLVKIDYGS